ncbi:response regulator transcription factor [Nonomuraea sp. PA05]|uniref:response regulator n=1 Tax=Nonomuraea sp. PA05 TaxID=2604466 RepID=UPI0011D685C7|nr:response regulator transcription factor [Nonomuraea sp. PA05]TYB52992.1 response regulator transcription factor [Nonomuraea sp. PA05]
MTQEAAVIRVMLVDDQILMREGLRKLLEIEPGIEIAVSAAGGEEALTWLASTVDGGRPQVALVDARMPGMDGVELVARLRARFPEVAPVILTTFDDDDYIFGGLRAGAKGYLLKDIPPDELVAAIRRAARGETVLGGAASERLVALLRAAPAQLPAQLPVTPPREPPGGLSDREYEIALLIGAGASNREIARGLHITEGTAKNHISSCLRKLGLRDRTQLAVWVSRHASANGSGPGDAAG